MGKRVDKRVKRKKRQIQFLTVTFLVVSVLIAGCKSQSAVSESDSEKEPTATTEKTLERSTEKISETTSEEENPEPSTETDSQDDNSYHSYKTYSQEQYDLIELYNRVKARSDEIDEEFREAAMDQNTMNLAAEENYANWDTLLNQIWAYLKDNLDDKEMEELKADQIAWIEAKENAVKEAGEEAGGGSMQPLLEFGEASSRTKERVDYLMDWYIR